MGSNPESLIDAPGEVKQVQWSREAPNSYEISSRGDSRFSAFYAKLADGRTIEEAYQLDVKGYRKGGAKISEAKGKPPVLGILIEEDLSEGYARRTRKNASADITIAFAIDFESAGERLTKQAVREQNKKYIAIDARDLSVSEVRVAALRDIIKETKASSINIAGNGIYTLKNQITQQQADTFVYNLLSEVLRHPDIKSQIKLIRSGGQTGFDEAGAKAGQRLGIRTEILAPKGFKFRDIRGVDIADKQKFLDRFLKTREQCYAEYKDLWKDWAKQNPALIEELRTYTKDLVLTDMFATTEINQARVLSEILNETALVRKASQNETTTEQQKKMPMLLAKRDHCVVTISDPGTKTKLLQVVPIADKAKLKFKTPIFLGTKLECEILTKCRSEEERNAVIQWAELREKQRVPMRNQDGALIQDEIESIAAKFKHIIPVRQQLTNSVNGTGTVKQRSL